MNLSWIYFLVTFFVLVLGHRLCPDGTDPIDLSMSFCTMYDGLGTCCTTGEETFLSGDFYGTGPPISSECFDATKSVFCGQCDPWAIHLVGEVGTYYLPNRVPLLCPTYCNYLYESCKNETFINGLPFDAVRLTDRFPDSASFCSVFANDGTKDFGGYCFSGSPYDPGTVPPFDRPEDAICIEDVARPGPDFISGAFSPEGNRFLYGDRYGRIYAYDTSSNPFIVLGMYLDLSANVTGDAEGGILGIAFHPNWLNNGIFYISYTPSDFQMIISSYRSMGLPITSISADPIEHKRIAVIQQSGANHNGGHLLFGPDGYLYVFVGDGGGNGHLDAQDLSIDNWSGKIHRIDVTDPNFPYSIPPTNPFYGDETKQRSVYAWGFRNPWRGSFDRATGDLYVGDVGHDRVEEVDIVSSGSNYGWRKFEGTLEFQVSDPLPLESQVAFPEFQYTRAFAGLHGAAVIGGNVYRGSRSSCHFGRYVFADFLAGMMLADRVNGTWSFRRISWKCADVPVLGSCNSLLIVYGFAEDSNGELYVLGDTALYRIVQRSRCASKQISCSIEPVQTTEYVSPPETTSLSTTLAQTTVETPSTSLLLEFSTSDPTLEFPSSSNRFSPSAILLLLYCLFSLINI